MAMSSGSGTCGMQATPNVTPMIDVMLVLLIIFMVLTPMLLAGFTADPPKAINLKDHPEDADNDHVLGIGKDGNYYFDKKLIKAEAIGPRLDSIFGAPGRTDFVLYLRADEKTKYSKVQDAMEMAMKNKVHVIGLVGDQLAGTTSTIKGDTRADAPVGK
jgi:biopolymer transport protein TolR